MRHEDPRNGGNERRVVGDGDVDVEGGAAHVGEASGCEPAARTGGCQRASSRA